MRFLSGLLLGLICAFVLHVYHNLIEWEYEQKLSEARVDAQVANETRDHLLSNGRFVRVYDAKRNLDYYAFKPFVTDFNYGKKQKFIALNNK
jgi:hypothetical protein